MPSAFGARHHDFQKITMTLVLPSFKIIHYYVAVCFSSFVFAHFPGLLHCAMRQSSPVDGLSTSSNRLEFLPATFGNLTLLQSVEVNCNKLTRLPDSIGKLKCHTFAANSNGIAVLTPQIQLMASSLRRLSLCDNRLEELPTEVRGVCT